MNQPPVVPSIDTHVPLTSPLPDEPTMLADGRPDLPTPSLWQKSVRATHKVTGRQCIIVRVDYGTNMFRAFFPNEGPAGDDGKPVGRFAERTEWEYCRDWNVEVTFSARELDRRAARELLDAEIAKLDTKELAAVMVLCEDSDPAKALAKLEALRAMGVVKASPVVAQAAMTESKGQKK